MNLRRIVSAVMLYTMILPVFAENTLIPPSSAKYIAVDGKDASPMNIDAKTGIKLPDGQHQIAFQVKSLIRDANDTNLYTSKPYIMTFDLQGDQKFTIKEPRMSSSRDVDALEKSPAKQLVLINENGEQMPFELAALKKSGLVAGDPVNELDKFNLSDNPAAVRSFSGLVAMPVAAQTVVTEVAPQPAPATGVPTSESMLKYWYNQTDEDSRKRFLEWVAKEK